MIDVVVISCVVVVVTTSVDVVNNADVEYTSVVGSAAGQINDVSSYSVLNMKVSDMHLLLQFSSLPLGQ